MTLEDKHTAFADAIVSTLRALAAFDALPDRQFGRLAADLLMEIPRDPLDPDAYGNEATGETPWVALTVGPGGSGPGADVDPAAFAVLRERLREVL